MKRAILLLSLLATVSARAAGAGAYAGKMDTDALGDSLVYGAQLEFDFFPSVSLLVRGGYASDFDEYKFVGSSGTLVADDLSIVPVEVGLMFRPMELAFSEFGIYIGGGAGWYGIPGFDVRNGRTVVAETDDVTDLLGWWVAAGVEFGTTGVHLFGEVKYQCAEEEDLDIEFRDRTDIGNLRADMDLTGVTFLAGIRFDW